MAKRHHKDKPEVCPKCGTLVLDALGIGSYCPNTECDVVNDVGCWPNCIKITIKPPINEDSYERGYKAGWEDAMGQLSFMLSGEVK
jgi:hypothetical protein